MRWLELTLVFLSFAALAAEENPLKPLAKDMSEMELMLRDDRHDAFVRIKGDKIAESLDGMISKIEKEQSEQKQQQSEEQKQKQQRQQSREQRQQQLSNSPLANSQPKPPVPSGPTDSAAQVSGQSSRWAKLPPAVREELLQSYRDDLPERWRKRLEAYFFSIAVEETEKDRRR